MKTQSWEIIRNIVSVQVMEIDDLIDAIQSDCIRVTDHAVDAADDDDLLLDDVFSSVFQGEIIERYPEERPYPRYLIYSDPR
jgi:hypothetical protein